MKKIIALLLMLATVFCLVACNEDTDAESDAKVNTDAVGEVSVEEEKKAPTPDEEYVLWKETSTKNGLERLYEYNEKGHLTRVLHNYPDGRVEEDLYEYTYNDDGSYSVYEDGYIISEKLSKYDAEGRLVEQIQGPSNVNHEITTYTYADNTVEIITKDQDGYIKSWRVETYENDLLVKYETFLSNGESTGYFLYLYDENGNQTAQETYTPDGVKNSNNAVYVWTEEYDEFGRVIEKTKNVPETGGYARKEIYEYDEKGGMCKMTVGISIYEYRPLSECIK